MISTDSEISINGKSVKSSPGSCKTYNIIYAVKCKLCATKNGYIGRSTRNLNVRIGEHRTSYYKLIEGENIDTSKDDFSLGLHLFHEHNFRTREMFDKTYEVAVIQNVSPLNLETAEHLAIHKYRTLRPNGINTQNPFAIPLIK